MANTGGTAVGRFNQMVGRLRVSVSHGCQLHCKFCHREAISSHWQPIHMPVATFRRLVAAFCELGGREIDVTGGDPLVHPDIGRILEQLRDISVHRALCTNGLLLGRVEEQLRAGYIDEIKMSVHASSDIVGQELLGMAWSATKVDKALGLAREIGVRTTMNFSVTSDNLAEFDAVLEKSMAYGTDLLVIDLISTKWDMEQSLLNATSFSPAVARVAALGRPDGSIVDRTGCRLTRFVGPAGQHWLVKDVRNGLLFTGMCNGCRVRAKCGEGVFVLRADSEGTFRPCLLREDLATRTSIDDLSVEEIKSRLSDRINTMMREPYEVTAGVSLYRYS